MTFGSSSVEKPGPSEIVALKGKKLCPYRSTCLFNLRVFFTCLRHAFEVTRVCLVARCCDARPCVIDMEDRPLRQWIVLPRPRWSAGTRCPPDTCERFAATRSTPWSGGKPHSGGARTTRSTPSSTNPSLTSATFADISRATCEQKMLLISHHAGWTEL